MGTTEYPETDDTLQPSSKEKAVVDEPEADGTNQNEGEQITDETNSKQTAASGNCTLSGQTPKNQPFCIPHSTTDNSGEASAIPFQQPSDTLHNLDDPDEGCVPADVGGQTSNETEANQQADTGSEKPNLLSAEEPSESTRPNQTAGLGTIRGASIDLDEQQAQAAVALAEEAQTPDKNSFEEAERSTKLGACSHDAIAPDGTVQPSLRASQLQSQTAEPSLQTPEPPSQTAEQPLQTTDLCLQTNEPSSQTTEPSPQTLEPAPSLPAMEPPSQTTDPTSQAAEPTSQTTATVPQTMDIPPDAQHCNAAPSVSTVDNTIQTLMPQSPNRQTIDTLDTHERGTVICEESEKVIDSECSQAAALTMPLSDAQKSSFEASNMEKKAQPETALHDQDSAANCEEKTQFESIRVKTEVTTGELAHQTMKVMQGDTTDAKLVEGAKQDEAYLIATKNATKPGASRILEAVTNGNAKPNAKYGCALPAKPIENEPLSQKTPAPARPGAQHCVPRSAINSTTGNSEQPSMPLSPEKRRFAMRSIQTRAGSRAPARSSSQPSENMRDRDESSQGTIPMTVHISPLEDDSTSSSAVTETEQKTKQNEEHKTKQNEEHKTKQNEEHKTKQNDEAHSQCSTKNRPKLTSKEEESDSVQSFKALAAELVDPASELERMERQVLKAIKDDAVVAVEVTPTRSKLRLHCTIVAVVTFILAGTAAVTAIFAFRTSDASMVPTMAPTLPPEERITGIVDFINQVTLSGHTIEYPAGDSATPEEQAIAWMIHEDSLRLTVADEQRFLQRFALVCLLKSNPENGLGASWLEAESECFWSGVECSATGEVIGLDLEEKGLTARLPEDLGFLSHIRELAMDNNGLSGTIPSSLGMMTDLAVFRIGRNQLSGTVPWDVLLNMANLEMISMGKNKFSGPLPTSIGDRWRSLRVFSLWSNDITGPIPSDFSGCSMLTVFVADNTLLSGSLPSTICAWTNLEEIYAGDSSINGTLPSSISAWTNLRVFSIPRVEMVGTLPKEIADQWMDVEYFDLSVNAFTGTIPSNITKWESLDKFWIENNQFTGIMPLCDVDPYWKVLSTDCEVLNCTCCTHCCPEPFLDIPMYPGCASELK